MTTYELPLGYLSPTQIWSYLSCPACYEAAYIDRIPRPLAADLLIGSAVHAAVSDARSMIVQGAEAGDVERSTELLCGAAEATIDRILNEASISEDGTPQPVDLDLGKKVESLDDAKDMSGKLLRVALPELVRYDVEAGIAAYEARVWHLGTPLPADHFGIDDLEDWAAEAEEQAAGVEPVFPFPVRAYLDVLYQNGTLKDLKTASRSGSPDALAAIQLLLYGWPWHAAGTDLRLGWDVVVKNKTPLYRAYWANGDGVIVANQWDYVRQRVLEVAADITAGRFPVNEASHFHRYEHPGLPTGELALTR